MSMTAVRPIGKEEVEQIFQYFAQIKNIFQMNIEGVRITEIEAAVRELDGIIEAHKEFLNGSRYLRILVIVGRDLKIFVASPSEMFMERIKEAIDRSLDRMAVYLSLAS